MVRIFGNLSTNSSNWTVYPSIFFASFVSIVVRLCFLHNIQGVSWLVDITVRGDFLGLCDQKISYKHVSDFGRLRSYGNFLIPVYTLMWTASYGTSWRVIYSTWWLIVCLASIIFPFWLVQFTTERRPVLRPAVAFSKTSFMHKSIQIKGNFTKLTLHLYFKCIMYYAGLLFCSVYCQ